MAAEKKSTGLGRILRSNVSAIVVAPSFAASLLFVYGFIAWTVYMSFTSSRMLPKYDLIGLQPYVKMIGQSRFSVAFENLFIFGVLFIAIALILGCFLAVLLDQKIRIEGVLRTIYLYPMAISFIVTGVAWKWILNPSIGIEKFMLDHGFSDFTFNWIVDRDMAVYTLVIAAVWQASGFVMAMVLAALRGVDQEIIKAAQLDGASMPRIYTSIILPSIRPVFVSAFVILMHLAIKSFDLVVALTGGGPGFQSTLPANLMYELTFRRNAIAQGSASAVFMLGIVLAIIVPYLYSELREQRK